MPWVQGELTDSRAASEIMVQTAPLTQGRTVRVGLLVGAAVGFEGLLQVIGGATLRFSQFVPVTLSLVQFSNLGPFYVGEGDRIRFLARGDVSGTTQVSLFYDD